MATVDDFLREARKGATVRPITRPVDVIPPPEEEGAWLMEDTDE